MSAKRDATPALPRLSPFIGKTIVARFDGGLFSPDGGVVMRREIEQRLSIADRLAACVSNPGDPRSIAHSIADIIRLRVLMVGTGYVDGNDAASLPHDPDFKLALGHLPQSAALCSRPTIPRLENLPRRRDLRRMGRAMVAQYWASFRQMLWRITLDVDDIRLPGDTVGAEPDLEARKKADRASLALVGQKRAGDRVQP